jgi:4-amino-4-deoxy-L-arabinose transferase-like glycosyltransferase
MPRRSSLFLASTLLLGLSVVWFRPGPTLLIGGDSGCYARVGRELAERPANEWLSLTLAHEPFFEHPPLGLWVNGVVVSWFGPRPEPLVWLARLYASLTLLVLAAAAAQVVSRRGTLTDALDGPTLAGFSVLGALTLPGFLYQSQVAMLEAPLTLALAVGLWAIAGMLRSATLSDEPFPRTAVTVFVLAVTAGFWVKGPPVLVLVGVLAVAVAFGWLRAKWALVAAGVALSVTLVTALGFDALRESRGLPPYFSTYLSKQVLASVTEGRHHPEPSPFFYVRPTLSWYGPAVGALLLGGLALGLRVRLAKWLPRLRVEALGLGAALWLGVIVGFSVPVQKYQWYVHPGLVGAALLVGGVLALLPGVVDRLLTVACLVVALAWPFVRLAPWDSRLSETQRQLAALQSASGPRPGDAIADCSPMDWWVSGHLMGFLWDAKRVDCAAPAAWRFDGKGLAPTSAP